MKKFALALMAAAVATFGAGMVADAYPPTSSAVSVDDTTPAAGGTYTVTATGCAVGEGITFTQGSSSDTDTCVASGAAGFALFATPATTSASGTLTAPSAAGTFSGTVSGDQGFSGSFSVTVAAAPADSGGTALPATGSDGIGTTTWIAAGLLLAGLGLFAVATVRRRQTVIA